MDDIGRSLYCILTVLNKMWEIWGHGLRFSILLDANGVKISLGLAFGFMNRKLIHLSTA